MSSDIDTVDLRASPLRAMTELLAVWSRLFIVAGEPGDTYTVDVETHSCTCPDAKHRDPDGGCKHVRRALFWSGEARVPDWVNRDALDPLLADRLAELETSD